MAQRKERLTVTVDPQWVAAGNSAVERGMADSLSAWVNEALAAKADRDRRLLAMDEAIAGHESEFGEITETEMAEQRRADRETATVVRSGRLKGSGSDDLRSRQRGAHRA